MKHNNLCDNAIIFTVLHSFTILHSRKCQSKYDKREKEDDYIQTISQLLYIA